MKAQLDKFLPRYDVRDRHSIVIDASPETVLAEVLRMTAREVPVMVALMAIRLLPELLRGRRVLGLDDRPIVQQMERARFVRLAATDDELVLGVVGRFWRPSGDRRRISAEDFARFDEPGWAKAAVNFRAVPDRDHTRLSTETRVLACDAWARRRFGCYWRLIYPGSAAIRIAWLRAIRGRAERSQPANASSSRSTSPSVV
jgi:hypothetical protein